MINFYGGPKGENYVVSHTFGNTQELLKDLELGGASPVDLNEIVMISYGLPGSEKYEENMKKDYSSDIIENFYFTYNPYLEYYPSVEHHFGTNGHNKLYTILDPRYEGSYNGIKNMMQSSTKNCEICKDNGNGSIWIKINLTGKIKFDGEFILDNQFQFNSDTTGITWHLASSIEEAREKIYPESEGKATFKVNSVPIAGILDKNLYNDLNKDLIQTSQLGKSGILTIENNQYFVIDIQPAQEQLYAILEIHPQTAINFTKFEIDRSGLQFNSYNFNSCLYQKVLKDTINHDDPFMYITFQGSNFAYKFLNSSIGSSPIINFNRNIDFINSNELPSIEKNTELSNSRHQIFDLKLPYPSTIKSNEDKKGVYLQLDYKENDEVQTPKIYMPNLNVDVNSNKDGLKITVTNNATSKETSIIVVPEFKIEDGNISWQIKGSGNNWNLLGNIRGPQGIQGPVGPGFDVIGMIEVTGANENINETIVAKLDQLYTTKPKSTQIIGVNYIDSSTGSAIASYWYCWTQNAWHSVNAFGGSNLSWKEF